MIDIDFIDNRYVLLKPTHIPPEWLLSRDITRSPRKVGKWLNDVNLLDLNDVVAFDFETNSLDVFGNSDFRAVGLALSHGERSIYLDLNPYSKSEIRKILRYLWGICDSRSIPLIAHNLFYDGAVNSFYTGTVRGSVGNSNGWSMFKHCTLYLFRMYSGEGWTGQKFGLKTVMTDLLLWEDTNEVERDKWLIANGFVKKNGGADPKEMWRVPAKILGQYAQLDAFATYQFYRNVLLPIMETFRAPIYTDYIYPAYVSWIRHWIDNYRYGVRIDRDKLLHTIDKTVKLIHRTVSKMWKVYSSELEKIRLTKLKKFDEKHPIKFREKIGKWDKTKIPENKYSRDGKLNKQWLRNSARKRLCERIGVNGKSISKVTMSQIGRRKKLKKLWKLHRDTVRYSDEISKSMRPFLFNPNSVETKKTILYTEGTYTIAREHKGPDYGDRGEIKICSIGLNIEMTKSGGLPVGAEALMALRPKSVTIEKYNKSSKELQFMTSLLSRLVKRKSGWFAHLRIKAPGTHTLRAGGDGGLNQQNQPKAPEYLSAWIPYACNHLLFQSDFVAVEPHVECEASRDPLLFKLYGPDAKKNDLYLFNACQIGGQLEKAVRKHGYDPDNPVPEVIEKCKKAEKKIRGASKLITLSGTYGAGPATQFRKMKILGLDFTFGEVKNMNYGMKRAYAGTARYARELEKEHETTGGWVLDPLGTVVCVDEGKKKDLKNRCIQKTGHMCLVIFLWVFAKALDKHNIEYYWVVFDFHDEFIMSVRIDQIPLVRKLARELNDWVNNLLGGEIKLKLEPQVASSLAEIKVEKYRDDNDMRDLVDELNEIDDGDNEDEY